MMMKIQVCLKLNEKHFWRRLVAGISKFERRAILAAALLLVFLSFLPVFKLFWERPPGFAVSGLEPGSSDDLAVYFSYIIQAASGEFFLKDLYTFEEGAGAINLVWWILGFLAKIFHLAPPHAFYIARIIMAPVLVLALYFFANFFLKKPGERVAALYLALFGSGLGAWFYPFLKITDWSASGRFSAPLDLSVPEFSPFWSSLYSPHFTLSWIFLAASVVLLIKIFEDFSVKRAVFAGILGLFYFHFHPYYAPFLAAFALGLFVYSSILKKEWKKPLLALAAYLVLSAPSVLYHLALIFSDYVSAARAAQNQTWSPPFYMSIIGAGAFLPLAALGSFWAKKNFRVCALIFLSLLHPVFMYWPWSSQRRFSEGWILPLAILSVYALRKMYPVLLGLARSSAARKFILASLFFIFFAGSNYSILSSKLSRDSRKEKEIYLSPEFIGALNSIKEFSGDNILAEPKTAKVIPFMTGKRVYAGHWAETIFSQEKFKLASFFYSEKPSDAWRKAFLKRNNISLIYWDEDGSSGEWDPRGKEYLKPIYGYGKDYVFAVTLK